MHPTLKTGFKVSFFLPNPYLKILICNFKMKNKDFSFWGSHTKQPFTVRSWMFSISMFRKPEYHPPQKSYLLQKLKKSGQYNAFTVLSYKCFQMFDCYWQGSLKRTLHGCPVLLCSVSVCYTCKIVLAHFCRGSECTGQCLSTAKTRNNDLKTGTNIAILCITAGYNL